MTSAVSEWVLENLGNGSSQPLEPLGRKQHSSETVGIGIILNTYLQKLVLTCVCPNLLQFGAENNFPEANIAPYKLVVGRCWKMNFLLGRPIFRGFVCFRLFPGVWAFSLKQRLVQQGLVNSCQCNGPQHVAASLEVVVVKCWYPVNLNTNNPTQRDA